MSTVTVPFRAHIVQPLIQLHSKTNNPKTESAQEHARRGRSHRWLAELITAHQLVQARRLAAGHVPGSVPAAAARPLAARAGDQGVHRPDGGRPARPEGAPRGQPRRCQPGQVLQVGAAQGNTLDKFTIYNWNGCNYVHLLLSCECSSRRSTSRTSSKSAR